MPQYDRLITIGQPAQQRTIVQDLGYLRNTWPPGNVLGGPQWLTSDELTLPVLQDRFDQDGQGNIRTAFIPYRGEDAGVFSLAWGALDSAQYLNLNVDAVETWTGLLFGSPLDGELLPLVPSNDDRFVASARLLIYASPTEGETPNDLRTLDHVVTWRVAEISEWQHGLRNVIFGEPKVLEVEDFTQGEIGKNTTPFYGLRLDFELAYADTANKKVWARLTDTRDAGIDLTGSAQLDLVYRRDWEMRYLPRAVLDVTSKITDDEGEVWTVIERNETGRRRFVSIVGERKVYPNG